MLTIILSSYSLDCQVTSGQKISLYGVQIISLLIFVDLLMLYLV